jgi:hypothetical protein
MLSAIWIGLGRSIRSQVAIFFELSAIDHVRTAIPLPNTAEANQRYPRPRDRVLTVDLIKQCLATDKIWTTREWHS